MVENYEGYVSLVRGAAGGHEGLREIYEESREALTGRLFEGPVAEEAAALGLVDTPAVRLIVRGLVGVHRGGRPRLGARPAAASRRDELLMTLSASLPAILAPQVRVDGSADPRAAPPWIVAGDVQEGALVAAACASASAVTSSLRLAGIAGSRRAGARLASV